MSVTVGSGGHSRQSDNTFTVRHRSASAETESAFKNVRSTMQWQIIMCFYIIWSSSDELLLFLEKYTQQSLVFCKSNRHIQPV